MTGTQRGALALFLIGLTCLIIGTKPQWFVTTIIWLGYFGFILDDVGRLLLRVAFTLLWWAGWLWRRITFQREPARTSPE